MRLFILLPLLTAVILTCGITSMPKKVTQKNKHTITTPNKAKSAHPATKPKKKKKKPAQKTEKQPVYIALPEEYCEISRCAKKPTLMVAYFNGKTIELGFFHKKNHPDMVIK